MPREQRSSGLSCTAQSRLQWRPAGPVTTRRAARRISEIQRVRLLRAALGLASAGGCEAATVTAIVSGAGVSRKTFYQLFRDRDDCLLMLLDESVSQLAAVVAPAWEATGAWAQRLRSALVAALGFLESVAASAALVVSYLVGRGGRGPISPELRAGLLERLCEAVEEGRSEAARRHELSPLAAEFAVGGVLAVIDARLHEPSPQLVALTNQLLWMIVLPYLGPAAARRELAHTAPTGPLAPGPPKDEPLRRLNMRVTYRTARVLEVIAHSPGVSNAEVAIDAGITDAGQISKLLARLAGLGLIENAGPGQSRGGPNAWSLTEDGRALDAAIRRRPLARRR
jgi:AcrR family transcriptional regulator/DNA-binding MarR family transcriptional regulator